jgi:hypothetical protein
MSAANLTEGLKTRIIASYSWNQALANSLGTSSAAPAGSSWLEEVHWLVETDRREALTSHGDKVLPLGAPHLRVAQEPEEVRAESLLAPESPNTAAGLEPSPVRHRHYFRREALYELVWTAPVAEVAKRLGVSDVALTKLCRRARIPIPGRTYWQRTEAGQLIGPAPLRQPPEGLPELLRIRGTKATTASNSQRGEVPDAANLVDQLGRCI